MDFSGVPVIVVCCYILGELYKLIFQKKQEANKFIPVVMAAAGGLLGVVIFLTCPEMLLNAQNVWVALGIGVVSGATATGTNQIVKQLFGKKDTTQQ